MCSTSGIWIGGKGLAWIISTSAGEGEEKERKREEDFCPSGLDWLAWEFWIARCICRRSSAREMGTSATDIDVLHLAERLKLPSKAGDLLAPSPLGAGKAEFVRPPRVSEELQKSFSTEEHVLNEANVATGVEMLEQLVFGVELTSRRGSPLALPEILEGLDFPPFTGGDRSCWAPPHPDCFP